MHNYINILQESQQLKTASSEQLTVQLSNVESVFDVKPSISIQPTPTIPISQPVQRISLTQPTPQQFAQPTPKMPVAQPMTRPTRRVPVQQPITQPSPRVSVPRLIPQPTPRVPVPQPIAQRRVPVPQPITQPTPKVPVAQPITQPTPRVPVPQPIAQPAQPTRVSVPQPITQPTQMVPVLQPITQPAQMVPIPQSIAQPTPRVPVPQSIAQPTPSVPTTRSMTKMPSASLFSQKPQKWIAKGHQRTSSARIIHEPLKVSNYRLKFHELLKLEEIAHQQLLEERLAISYFIVPCNIFHIFSLCRCNGKHSLVLLQAGLKPEELRFDEKPYHAQYGYFKDMGSDQVSYATQSASAAIIKMYDSTTIKCDILNMNYRHTEERLYVAFAEEAIMKLSPFFGSLESPYPLAIEFRLKYSYFRSLKEAIRNIQEDVIARILPNPSSFVPCGKLNDTRLQPFQELCSPDQLAALKVIASAPSTGPPVLISGPFGTGKTRVLAIAAHYFLQQSFEDRSSLRILVCTQQHNSADAYLEMYNSLTTQDIPITIIRLITEQRHHPRHHYKTVKDFKIMKCDSKRNNQRFLVITTCLTAKKIADFLPHGFFTHIFLDEGAQMREPEAIAPLSMATWDTKIVIAGDKYQVIM